MAPLAVVVVIAALAGCGGGSDSGSSSTGSSQASSGRQGGSSVKTSSLSKEEFIAQASAACSQERNGLVEEVTAYLEKHESEGLPDGVAIAKMAKAVLLPTIETEIAAVKKLGAPAGDEEEISSILDTEEREIKEVEQLKRANNIDVIERYFIDSTKQLQAYGFVTACTNWS
jgi:hypothetical protein